MQVDHVVLWVGDAAKALAFYCEVVGLEAVRGDEFRAGKSPFPSVRVCEGSILDLVPAQGAPLVGKFTGEKIPTAAGKPINHVCLAMTGPVFDALASRLAAASVETFRVGETSFGARGSSRHWFYFQDPDGNVLEARYYE
jgi:catechol 2,3-dioxygenase-like lactoylglutathione lyase family enzyme